MEFLYFPLVTWWFQNNNPNIKPNEALARSGYCSWWKATGHICQAVKPSCLGYLTEVKHWPNYQWENKFEKLSKKPYFYLQKHPLKSKKTKDRQGGLLNMATMGLLDLWQLKKRPKRHGRHNAQIRMLLSSPMVPGGFACRFYPPYIYLHFWGTISG